jgi:hypothetical protein
MNRFVKKLKKKMNQQMKTNKMQMKAFNFSKIKTTREKPKMTKSSLLYINIVEHELMKVAMRIRDLLKGRGQSDIQVGLGLRPQIRQASINLLFEITEYNSRRDMVRYALGIDHGMFKGRNLQESDLNLPGKSLQDLNN